ncbi:MAG TPA: 2-oxo acid dehydrogenase subunit E2, partial [Acidimicrobiia bacterium]|nr:2-oxo acid dehydrogenase subunit E2 [Acidimicrobiia bacterium]
MPETPDTSAAGRNDWLIEEMYERYLDSPRSVSEPWRRYFENGGRSPDGPVAPAPTAPEQPEEKAAPSPSRPEPAAETDSKPAAEPEAEADVPDNATALKGISGVIAERMDESLGVPTATSVRNMPAKLLEVNRKILNNQLKRVPGGGKVSFTHLIGWAVIRAMREYPEMNVSYREIDGAPHIVRHPAVNLGLAIDMERPDGTRVLLVPAVKGADQMDFRAFWEAYEVLVAKTRNNKLSPDDFAGTTATLTNPGTIGTVQSVPRLM